MLLCFASLRRSTSSHAPRPMELRRLALRSLALLPTILLSQSCAENALSVPAHPAAKTALITASFEPAWFARDGWSIAVTNDGRISSKGRQLGRVRRRASPEALSKLVQSSVALSSSLDSATYRSSADDPDRLRLTVQREGRIWEYIVDDPMGGACSTDLRTIARLWNTLLETAAPDAICNGLDCTLCAREK